MEKTENTTMKTSTRIISTLPFILIYSADAQAYFDPGVGSIIIQSLVAAGAFMALFWNNMKLMVRSILDPKSKHRASDVEPQEAEEQEKDMENLNNSKKQ